MKNTDEGLTVKENLTKQIITERTEKNGFE